MNLPFYYDYKNARNSTINPSTVHMNWVIIRYGHFINGNETERGIFINEFTILL